MHIKSIVAGAAIALAAAVGSASAAEQFNTLDGIAAQPLTAQQKEGVRGSIFQFIITPNVSDSAKPLPSLGPSSFEPPIDTTSHGQDPTKAETCCDVVIINFGP